MTAKLCPQCGAALETDGTCAVCMLAGGFADELNSGPSLSDPEPDTTLEYDSFDPYRILRVLGEGGMGTVYLAEQTQPLRRQVALKVLKLGLDSTEILSRFHYERRALALMEHPNIARAYAAGASEKKRPYFVMEYVDGLAITEYCDQHRLDIRERLELFVPVCQAVQHAHQKGVIHRDIKPSNVMVTSVDGRPVPKVIDFGIARATDPRSSESGFTHLGQFIGTAEYMSPEQADLVTGDVDASSDVYSLGILLYELLAGAVPFDAAMLRKAGPVELLRIIREDQAMSMTAKLTRMGEQAVEVAARRRTDAIRLRQLVGGDLKWIVMKAIAKDRRVRYATAAELAADIRLHLDDQPVMASPPSATYVVGKFVRRHRIGVVAAAAVVIALIGGLVAASWEAAIARQERVEALRQRSEAIAARALAEQRSREADSERTRAEEQDALAVRQRNLAEARLDDVHSLAVAMLFEINDDVKDLAGGTKAREALVRLGQQYLSKQESAQPDSVHRQELGRAFLKLGDLQGGPGSNLRDLQGARESYGRSTAILEKAVAGSPKDAALRHLLTVSYVREALLVESATAKDVGLKQAARSADIFVEHWPSDPRGQRDRAEVFDARGDFTAAVNLRERLLLAQPADPGLRWELAHSELELGISQVQRDNRASLQWLEKAAAVCSALVKEDPANVEYQRDLAVALMNQSRVLLPLDRIEDSVSRAKESVAMLDRITTSDRRSASFRLDLSDSEIALSESFSRQGQFAHALENISLAIAIQEEQAKRFPDYPDFRRQAAHYHRTAAVYKNDSSDFKGALEEYRAAEVIDRALTARYPQRLEFAEAQRADLDSIGDSWLGLGDKAEALRAYRTALEIAQATVRVQPTEEFQSGLASAHRGMVGVFKAFSRWEDAIGEQREVVAIYERRAAARPGVFSTQQALGFAAKELAMLFEGHGEIRPAIAASEKAFRMVEANFAAAPSNRGVRSERWNVLLRFSVEYPGVGRCDAAVDATRKMVALADESPNLGPFWRDTFRANSLRDAGFTYLLCGRRQEALATFRDAIAVLDKYPIATQASLRYQTELATHYLPLAEWLRSARREEESAELLARLLPAFEAMVRDNPANNLCRGMLLRAYRTYSADFLTAGDLVRALDIEKKIVRLEPDAGQSVDSMVRLARMGSLELQLGNAESARRMWGHALEGFERAARDGEREWSADTANLSARDQARIAQGYAQWMREQLADRKEVVALHAGDSRETVSLADRLRARVSLMELFADRTSARIEVLANAVDLRRAAGNRYELSTDLRMEGDAYRDDALRSKGAAAVASYISSRDCYRESLQLLTSLQASAQLPDSGIATLAALRSYIAEATERLGDSGDQRITARK